MKILAFIDRYFWLLLVLTLAGIGCGKLVYQSYIGVQINASLVFRALFPALLWLSIWLGARYWFRHYSASNSKGKS
ncbi:hypothetical protein M1D58_27415 (plasmid) [Pseudomonas sp. R4-76]|uniref:hypothetical protein n=1 Tax=unclassified Pseudomonas TaxID=196821 RepID=UPI003DA9CA28